MDSLLIDGTAASVISAICFVMFGFAGCLIAVAP
jgi:hypothetical protein